MDKNEPLMMGGEHYYLLNCRCPVCVERGLLTPEEIWLHAECGGYIYVGDKAHLLCDKCKNEIPITHAEFRCPYHSTSEDAYVVFHEHPFLHNWNIGVMSHLVKRTGLKWLQMFLNNLEIID